VLSSLDARSNIFIWFASRARKDDAKKLNIIAERVSSGEIPKRRQRDMSFAVHLSDATWRRGWIYCLASRVASRFIPYIYSRVQNADTFDCTRGMSIDGWKRAHRLLSSRERSILWQAIVYGYKEKCSCKQALRTSCKILENWFFIEVRMYYYFIVIQDVETLNARQIFASLLLLYSLKFLIVYNSIAILAAFVACRYLCTLRYLYVFVFSCVRIYMA